MLKTMRYIQELMYVIAIIALLSALAIRSYRLSLMKAEVMSVVSGVFESAKRDSLVYLALHGEFPENTAQALSSGLTESYESLANDYKTVIEQGAINITFREDHRQLPGKTLTMRPVVQDDDPVGAVHWVCGNKKGESGWKFFGVDRTDIDDRYLPAVLK
ncbi:MAG: pilin [Candidatus Electrothrix communis]|nr:pilin [Desulfobulbus sp. US4]WLE96641.1 MAG: pilin [Candidatus Electrothrix communis]